jgi:hypothetical protein
VSDSKTEERMWVSQAYTIGSRQADQKRCGRELERWKEYCKTLCCKRRDPGKYGETPVFGCLTTIKMMDLSDSGSRIDRR